MIAVAAVFVISMGVVARMAGRGTWGKVPEVIHSIAYGAAGTWGAWALGAGNLVCALMLVIGAAVSYAGMQSATWMFLRWESHDDPNVNRSSTLKPLYDKIAALFGYKLGDEGYAWIAAGIKGFLIGLPVGGVITGPLWALGYEIGSHAKGRVERFGIDDPHAVSEFMAGALGAVSILIYITLIRSAT